MQWDKCPFVLVPFSLSSLLHPSDGRLSSAAGHPGLACRSVRAQDALQRLRRALHEAGEEEVSCPGCRGPLGSLSSVGAAAVLATARLQVLWKHADEQRASLPLESPCTYAPGESPVLVASVSWPVE